MMSNRFDAPKHIIYMYKGITLLEEGLFPAQTNKPPGWAALCHTKKFEPGTEECRLSVCQSSYSAH